ncbi:MAG: TIGR03617 family F420-dependent LLM class oxidoreductase [bacterium]|nr:TIGR03617 family F420-dependent LLM class oxidoreductase [Gammaproteobacteria bacterium]HIL98689.1 TIGR03617 family F420-dependent LLM class oxidoreductase [Pseudomonadales bacterium]
MKVDASISADMTKVAAQVQRLESIGYDGVKIAELDHDPFLPLAIAAEHSEKIEMITSVAVAFARNPMIMANLAHDLNAFSQGRFILGLGTQVQPHIVKRFGMPWYKGPRQMREFINAMHAIFDCWYEGEDLDFDGEYYRHTLMPKTFTPQNTEAGRPDILLSATGPLMTKVAAEVADGLIMHPFSTERYIREVNLPAIEQGLANVDSNRDEFVVDFAPMIATGHTEEDMNTAIDVIRDRIAFYGSTPGYRTVLDLHGWGALQGELNRLMKQHRTSEMASLIDDEILHTFAIVGEPNAVVEEMVQRYSDIVDRTAFYAPSLADDEIASLIGKLQQR